MNKETFMRTCPKVILDPTSLPFCYNKLTILLKTILK